MHVHYICIFAVTHIRFIAVNSVNMRIQFSVVFFYAVFKTSILLISGAGNYSLPRVLRGEEPLSGVRGGALRIVGEES